MTICVFYLLAVSSCCSLLSLYNEQLVYRKYWKEDGDWLIHQPTLFSSWSVFLRFAATLWCNHGKEISGQFSYYYRRKRTGCTRFLPINFNSSERVSFLKIKLLIKTVTFAFLIEVRPVQRTISRTHFWFTYLKCKMWPWNKISVHTSWRWQATI